MTTSPNDPPEIFKPTVDFCGHKFGDIIEVTFVNNSELTGRLVSSSDTEIQLVVKTRLNGLNGVDVRKLSISSIKTSKLVS